MIIPMPGYVIAKLLKKKIAGGIILADTTSSKQRHDIVVENILPEDSKETGIKKGTIIFLDPKAQAYELQLPDEGNPTPVRIGDITCYKK